MWHGGANYPRISCTEVPKRGDVGITVTPGGDACLGHYGIDHPNDANYM